ncbi:HAD-IIB family hydrolase [Lacticaseibacillus pabuli]|uniref:HAD-IIB family hydrolase n=1 Tax=Lacticaseibacillus pabuli TaxID=3025672 RepID=A0ABY7WRD9_9LACO|nr:HAD-IIB family hydrolase [Lacticaseibacillus sp. KACC 23028]WDF82354.1 HAD-IIB family hydrolase [Lacticaseibacillus sp. KACC 23028]
MPFNIVTATSEVITRDRDVGAITALQAVENSTGILVRDPDNLPDGVQAIKGVFCGEETMLDQAEAGVRATFGAQYEVIRAGRPFLELMDKGVNKGSGAAHLATHLGLTADEVMAFGDEDNDVAMFDYAGLAVAMGNGNDAAKAHADYVTASNDDDGLARALQKFVL